MATYVCRACAMFSPSFWRVYDLVSTVLGGGWREGGQAALWPGALLLLGTCLQSAVGMRVLVCAGVCVTVRAGAHGIPCAPCPLRSLIPPARAGTHPFPVGLSG